MKVFRKCPGEGWELIEIDNTLEALQREVEGNIECAVYMKRAVVLCNEEGIPLGLAINRFFGYVLFGTILIVGVDGEEFCDVKEEWEDML